MANYAVLDENGVVVMVHVGKDENELLNGQPVDWEAYYGAKRTSYNTKGGEHFTDGVKSVDQTKAFRKNYAGIGFKYDVAIDAFIPPSPYPSWKLDEATATWGAPVPYPEDGKTYTWDEKAVSWVEAPAKGAVEATPILPVDVVQP